MQSQDDQPLGFYVNMLFRLSRLNIEPMAQSLGLTGSQIPFMAVIYQNSGISQDELSAMIYIDKAATARQLAKLESSGFVYREVDPDNRRKNKVYPTSHALKLKDSFWNILDESNQRSLAGLSEQECEQFREFLRKAIHNQLKYYQKDN